MKTTRQSLLIAAFAASALVSAQADTKTDITKPVGTLSATPAKVFLGDRPKLSWSIDYPSQITSKPTTDPTKDSTTNPSSNFDLQDVALLVTYNSEAKNNNGHGNNLDGVDCSNPGQGKGGPTGSQNAGDDPNGVNNDDETKATPESSSAALSIIISTNDTVTVNDDIIADVHVLGGYNKITESTYGKLTAEYKVSGKSWTNVFSNAAQNQLDPSRVYASVAVVDGGSIDFRVKGETSTGWTNWRATGDSTTAQNVVALVNGSTPPASAFVEGRIREYLKPVLKDGKVNIGPRDVLYLFELSNSDD